MEIPLGKISISKYRPELINDKDKLEGLTESIKEIGIIQPVIVFRKDDENYELIAGKRRFLACKKLGWNKIKAEIIEQPDDEVKAKMISLSENLFRRNMARKEIIDACIDFYYKYGSIKAVSENLKLPYNLIRDSVFLPRVPKEVQKAVHDREISLDIAMKATDALRWDSGPVEAGEKVLKLAKIMQNMTSIEKNAVIKEAQVDPSRDIDQIVKKSKNRIKARRVRELRFKLFSGYENDEKIKQFEEKIQEYALNANISEEESLVQILLDYLNKK